MPKNFDFPNTVEDAQKVVGDYPPLSADQAMLILGSLLASDEMEPRHEPVVMVQALILEKIVIEDVLDSLRKQIRRMERLLRQWWEGQDDLSLEQVLALAMKDMILFHEREAQMRYKLDTIRSLIEGPKQREPDTFTVEES